MVNDFFSINISFVLYKKRKDEIGINYRCQ